MDDLEARRRVAQQAMRARGVAASSARSGCRSGRGAPTRSRSTRAQAREALERAQLEELVEQERRGRAARRARGVEKARALRRTPRARAGARSAPPACRRERRRGAHRRRNRSGVVAVRSTSMYCADVAADADRAAAGAATCGRCRSRRARPECATGSGRPSSAVRVTRRSSDGRSGIIIAAIPRETTVRACRCRCARAVAIASG